MPERISKAQRSRLMAAIKSRDTKPEIVVRRLVHGLGYRFRLHGRDLPGTPDIVLPRHRKVINVHGCFWHRHAGCKIATTPKSNTEFWVDKFNRNVSRDAFVLEQLRSQGWYTLVVWECELSSALKVSATSIDVAKKIQTKT